MRHPAQKPVKGSNGQSFRQSARPGRFLAIGVLLLCSCVFEVDADRLAKACATECRKTIADAVEKAKAEQKKETLRYLYSSALGGHHLVLCADGIDQHEWTGAPCISVRAYP